MRLRPAAVVAGGLLALSAAACTGSSDPDPTTTPSAPSATPGLDGETVSVLGLWSGPERDTFAAVTGTWEDATGAAVDWTGSRDLAGDLAAAVAAGDPPDVAVLPNPGLLDDLVRDGAVLPLDDLLDPAAVARDYPATWTELGTVDGALYALPVKATDRSTVWYSPAAFDAAGYPVPATWDDLVAWAGDAAADGRTPLSVVAPRGPGSGWALTDGVASLLLGGCGPGTYDAWVAAEVPWSEECVRRSFDRFLDLVTAPGRVLGGVPAILTTGDAEGVLPVFTDPPQAYAYPMASFAQAFVADAYPDLVPGVGYDWFAFPAVDPALAGAVTVGADLVVALRDTPAARSFLAYLTGAEAQARWAGLGGYASVNRGVPAAAYPDAVARSVAEHLAGADVVRFGAGDAMPPVVQAAWSQAMLALVRDPGSLDRVLASLTAVAADAADR
ncbi:ABC transporter substrate-binding protein [Cellulomonas sp.]|uniref:ABC transporter substrate-binding protein n=1 Tax=Cellulomonas sp. TaxID=40001 RepID=UPI002D288A9B|nr:ABC transporter substrate-binding protein [Cellulomonas sp.]HYQ75613.1 ABC transporter substrate-binding protein [Cellulomonas sp.]